MRGIKQKLLLVCALVLFVGAPVALGDWDPGDGHKMHYPQLPDPNGWDVGWGGASSLSDDWQCSQTGLVTDIHFWVSFEYGEGLPADISSFNVEIWSNVPADPPLEPYSHPDEMLWGPYGFQTGTFTYRYVDTEWQGWMDPADPCNPRFNDHQGCWQINIVDLDELAEITEVFQQEEGEIYWLVINNVQTSPGIRVGWKQSGSPQFKDDAVWSRDDALPDWQELYEPDLGPVTDFFYADIDDRGTVTGGGSGWNGGQWYLYPSDWWNQWFYDHPYDPDRWKDIYIEVWVQPGQFGPDGWLTLAANWSTPEWSLFGNPPGPRVPPLPGVNENLYIVRNLLVDGPISFPMFIPVGSLVDSYNPEWVSIDIMGSNVSITEGFITHECIGIKSMDLAFVITGEPEPKQPVPNLKWSQPPIEYDPTEPEPRYCGWDEDSYTNDPNNWWLMVADDFRCLGNMPIDSIHWWGSHIGWDGDEPPYVAGIGPPIIGWRIGFWSNVPAGADPTGLIDWSYPKDLLWQIDVDAARVSEERVGMDEMPDPGIPTDTCFQYYVDLEPDEVFWQGDFEPNAPDDVFWLSISAVYPEYTQFEYEWGWKTRPWHWMDDGVGFYLDEGLEPGTTELNPANMEMWPIEDSWTGESYDLAFELDTDPNWIKWDQPYTGIRHWPHYEDKRSWMELWPQGPAHLYIVADDWQCQGHTPVTALAWYGSYLDYYYQPCNINLPKQLPGSPEQPAYFQLSMWTDVPDTDPCDPATWSHPDHIIWQYDAYNYDEVLVGYDKHSDPCGLVPGYEPVFRYSVRLPDPNWFWQDPNEQTVYWLSIVAVYEEHHPPYEWGWTLHQHVYNDDAVQTTLGGDFAKQQPEWSWFPIYDQTGESADMSFTLYTDPTIELDFGDAPDPNYPTLLANDGARHIIRGPWFGGQGFLDPCDVTGDMPDPETDGQPHQAALGDDLLDGNDDEDGVSLGTWIQGVATYDNDLEVSGGGGVVDFWIDWNGDGDWDDPGEQYTFGYLPNGYYSFSFGGGAPLTSVVGQTFTRWRISTNGTAGPEGLATDGEVEDHEVIIERGLDFGDTPDPCYPTLLPTGARHTIIPGVFLGASIDAELNGQPNATATGDDNDGNDDEDGVVFTSRLMPGRAASVNVTASVAGFLNAWVDFNADGDWADPCEQVFTNQPLTGGGFVDSLTFQVPLLVEDGDTFARFRFNTAGGLPYDGPSDDGEVEDYMVRVDRYFKWSQPPMFNEQSPYPQCFWGWDEPSDYWWTGPIIADDWACEDYRPVSDVHWWGSYVGWPEPFPPQQLLMGFHIGIWTNVKAGVDLPYSHPDRLIWEYYASYPDEVHEEPVGCDYYDAGPAKIPPVLDTCFRYDLELEEDDVFCQDPNYAVYWLSISAIYAEPPFEYQWGWKTREWYFEDDAIRIFNPMAPVLGSSFVSGEPIEDPPGTSWDMAFELTTNPDYCCDCGDFDHNGTIELNDVRIAAKNWLWTGTPGGYNIADLNCDGRIDNKDFVIFALQWLDSCP